MILSLLSSFELYTTDSKRVWGDPILCEKGKSLLKEHLIGIEVIVCKQNLVIHFSKQNRVLAFYLGYLEGNMPLYIGGTIYAYSYHQKEDSETLKQRIYAGCITKEPWFEDMNVVKAYAPRFFLQNSLKYSLRTQLAIQKSQDVITGTSINVEDYAEFIFSYIDKVISDSQLKFNSIENQPFSVTDVLLSEDEIT